MAQDDPKPWQPASADDGSARRDQLQLPGLQWIVESFARMLSARSLQSLREVGGFAAVETNCQAFETVSERWDGWCLNVFRSNGLKAPGLVAVSPQLWDQLVSGMLGGTRGDSEAAAGLRRPTAVDQRIARRFMLGVLELWDEAWSPFYATESRYRGTEADPRFATIMPPSQPACLFRLAHSGPQGGELHVVLPMGALQPLRSLLSRPPGPADAEGTTWWGARRDFREHLLEVPIDVTAVCGRAELSGREIASLSEGAEIPLQEPEGGDVEIEVEGVRKASGEFAEAHGQKAVRIRRSA